MITETVFKHRITSYIRDELSPDERQQMDVYLQQHPDAVDEMTHLHDVLQITDTAREESPPAGLLEAARADVLSQIEQQPAPERESWLSRLLSLSIPRPVYALGVATVLLIALLIGAPWSGSSALALEDILQDLKNISSLRVEGWIRNDDGARKPFRMWVQLPDTFRAEIGAPGRERIVISDGARQIIQDQDGTFYEGDLPGSSKHTSHTTSIPESFYEDENLKLNMSKPDNITGEDLGEVVLFSVPNWPLNNRILELEVRKDTQRPIRSRVYELGENGREAVSELMYHDYNVTFSADLFQPPALASMPASKERPGLWYERSITSAFTLVPARIAPEEDIIIKPLDAIPGMDGSITAGGGGWGGVKEDRFYRASMVKIIQRFSDTEVEFEESTFKQELWWFGLDYKEVIPEQDLIPAICRFFGLEAEQEHRPIDRRVRHIVTQDGREIPERFLKLDNSGGQIGGETDSTSVAYHQGYLKSVIYFMLAGAQSSLYNTSTDTIDYRWDGPPDASPFDTRVRLKFESDGSWRSNVQFLEDSLGIKITRRLESASKSVLVIRPAERPDMARIDAREQLFGGRLLEPVLKIERNRIDLPFVLHRDADVRIQVRDPYQHTPPSEENIDLSDWDPGRLFALRLLEPGRQQAGIQTVSWDLNDKDGEPVPDGKYMFILNIDGRSVHGRRVEVER